MTDSKENSPTITFRVPESTKRAFLSRLAANGVKLQWFLEQNVIAYVESGKPPQEAVPTKTSAPLEQRGSRSMIEVRRALQNAKAEIETALSALDRLETNRGQTDRDAAEEHLDAAERELDAAEQDSPTRSSAGAGRTSRKRIG